MQLKDTTPAVLKHNGTVVADVRFSTEPADPFAKDPNHLWSGVMEGASTQFDFLGECRDLESLTLENEDGAASVRLGNMERGGIQAHFVASGPRLNGHR